MGVAGASSRAPMAHLNLVPDAPPPPPDGAVWVPGMGDWVYKPGAGVWWLPRGGDEWLKKLGWCPEVVDAVRYPAQDGQTITRRFAIKVGDQQEVISLGDLTRGPAIWGKFAGARGFSGRPIGDALVNIVTDQASRRPDLIGYPTFTDGRLMIPPTGYLPDGYTNGEDSEPSALRELAAAISAYPVAAMIFGLSAAAPWVGALRLQPFTMHAVGDSTTGKTTAITAASALWGVGFKGVTQIWNGTRLSVPGQLRDLGVLPAFRDELSTAGLSPGDRAALFSVIMEGCKRGARTRDDLPRPSATWASVLFSTGNIAAVPASHASAGHPKGVIEVHADARRPIIPPDAKGRIQALTNAEGMAGSWVPFARRLTVEAMRQAFAGAGADLGEPPADGLHWHMWRAMSLAVAGARALAVAVGVPALAAAAEAAARDVIASAADRMEEIGADHGQRLIDALAEYLAFRPVAFGAGDPRDVAHVDQMGFKASTRDGAELVCVYPTKHQELARAAGVEDVTVALRQLRTDGRLITSRGQGLKYRTRVGGSAPICVYAYNITADAGQNSQNNQNSAGQGPENCSDQGPGKSEQPPRKSEQPPSETWGPGTNGDQANPHLDPEPAAAAPASVPSQPASPAPCRACREPLPANPALVFDGFHVCCAPEPGAAAPEPESPAEPTAAPASHSPEPAPAEPPAASTAPRGRQDAATSRRQELDPADELAAFGRTFTKHAIYPDATPADLAAALDLFHQVTGGLRWVSYAGQTGQAAFGRLLATYASMKPPRELTDERAIMLCREQRLSVTRYHVRPGQGRKLKPGQHVIGFDINGQYPSAAVTAELGDGNPQWIDNPRTLESLWDLPGYARLAAPVRGARNPVLKMIRNDGQALAAGDILPMPVVKYLAVDLGLELTANQVCYWPKHGRRLRAYIDHAYRPPRAALQAMPKSLARDMAMAVLKIMINDSIGMFRSETWSHGQWYRPDWHDQVTSLAEVNAFRAIDKATEPPVVKACDSLYWLAPTFVPLCDACRRGEPAKHAQPCGKPEGITVSSQLGKFKLERHADVTAAMIDAYKAGQPRSFHDAVKTAASAARTEGTE
jgi:hypothetical protein